MQSYQQTEGVAADEIQGLPILQTFTEGLGSFGIPAKYLSGEQLEAVQPLIKQHVFNNGSEETFVEFKFANLTVINDATCTELSNKVNGVVSKTYIKSQFIKESQPEFTNKGDGSDTEAKMVEIGSDFKAYTSKFKSSKTLNTALCLVDIVSDDKKVLLPNLLVRMSNAGQARSVAFKDLKQAINQRLVIPSTAMFKQFNIKPNSSYFKVPLILKKRVFKRWDEKEEEWVDMPSCVVTLAGHVTVENCLLPADKHNEFIVPANEIPLIEHMPTAAPVVLEALCKEADLNAIQANPAIKSLGFSPQASD